MTGTALELHETQGSSLTVTANQDFWNDKQLAGLRQLGIDGASNGDLAVYMHVCQRTGLDPFARQIHFIQRQGKWTIQTAIDGYRLIARRAVNAAHETLSIGESQWCDTEGNWSDVWLSDTPPSAARVTVMRNGQPYPATALWREYVQTKRDGSVTEMWRQRPAGQLAKCAEALALRKAFPQDLSGIYTDDEMHQSDRAQTVTVEPQTGSQRIRAIVAQPMPTQTREAGDEPPAATDVDEPASPEPTLDVAAWDKPQRTLPQSKKINALFGKLGIDTDDGRHAFMTDAVGRDIASELDLSVGDAVMVINRLVEMEEAS